MQTSPSVIQDRPAPGYASDCRRLELVITVCRLEQEAARFRAAMFSLPHGSRAKAAIERRYHKTRRRIYVFSQTLAELLADANGEPEEEPRPTNAAVWDLFVEKLQ